MTARMQYRLLGHLIQKSNDSIFRTTQVIAVKGNLKVYIRERGKTFAFTLYDFKVKKGMDLDGSKVFYFIIAGFIS